MFINIGGMNFGGGSSDKEIDGDSNSPVQTASGDVEISGDNNSSVNSASGDVEIGGANNGSIRTASGDIEIGGKNGGNVSSASGDVKIGGDNVSSIETASGDVNIRWANVGQVETSSGDVKIGKNSGKVVTVSGKIRVQEENRGELTTTGGEMTVGDMKIRIRRMGVSVGGSVSIIGDNVTQIVSGSGVSIISGSGTIVMGNVVVNGKTLNASFVGQDGRNDLKANFAGDQSSERKSGSFQEYVVHIDDVTIDFENKKITKDGRTTDIGADGAAKVVGGAIEFSHKGQTVKIHQEGVTVIG